MAASEYVSLPTMFNFLQWLMNIIISQNKVWESSRNDFTSVLICFPCQNIQNGSTERSKKNSKGSSVNFQ